MADTLSPLPDSISPRPDASPSVQPPPTPATIRIADETHPKDLRQSQSESEHRFRPLTRSDTTALAGGIYHSRAISRTGTQRSASLSRQYSIDRARLGDGDGEEGDNWRENEAGPKIKEVYKGAKLLWLAYQSVGAIYGDIGTSPLYVYSSVFTSAPDYEDVLQVLSLVLWSLTIMVTFKYVFIVLRADNEGEGGTFSCYSLLTRFVSLLMHIYISWHTS